MNRLTPTLHHLIAAACYAVALVAVSAAWNSQSLARWLTATVVCYIAAIATYQAAQASWRAWRAGVERRREVAPPPSAKAPLWTQPVSDSAFEALVAERAAARRARHAGGTEPLPALDDTLVMATVGDRGQS